MFESVTPHLKGCGACWLLIGGTSQCLLVGLLPLWLLQAWLSEYWIKTVQYVCSRITSFSKKNTTYHFQRLTLFKSYSLCLRFACLCWTEAALFHHQLTSVGLSIPVLRIEGLPHCFPSHLFRGRVVCILGHQENESRWGAGLNDYILCWFLLVWQIWAGTNPGMKWNEMVFGIGQQAFFREAQGNSPKPYLNVSLFSLYFRI